MNKDVQKLAAAVAQQRQQKYEEERAAWRSSFVANRLDAGRKAQEERQGEKEAAGEQERPRRALGY